MNLLKWLKSHTQSRPDIEEFNAEYEELRERLEKKIQDDETRRKIIEARARNFRRIP